jgi:hypothetical protein
MDGPLDSAEFRDLLHQRDRLLKRMRRLCESNMLRGSLSVVGRTCGKKTCACVTEGKRHQARYLSVKLEGRTRLLYVPAAQEAEVREAIAVHRRLANLVDELTVLNLALFKQTRPARRPAARKP